MGIQAHFLQDKNQEKFYPYAHADATFDKNGRKVGTRLDEIDSALASLETDIDIQADWSVSDSSNKAYIKNKPTSMPASDVSAWAKASTKPSYTWNEIGEKPSTFTPSTHIHDNATSDIDGFMSSEDKAKLDGIATGANKTIVDSALNSSSANPVQNKVINSALAGKVPTSRTINGKALSSNISLSASDVSAVPTSQKGQANGVAELGSDGKVPSSQLPSYVDDVLEYDSLSDFPETGETGKIYVTKDTNKTYRWSGSAYPEISASLALGETSSTAYRGDRGKIAYDHSQKAHAPSNAEANVQSDWSVTDTGSDAYIKNKPTSMPANGGNADTVNGHTVQINVPANAKFTDTTYSAGTGLDLSGTTFLLENSGVSAGSYGPTANVSGTNGTTINIPQITVDSKGRVTSVTNRVLTNRDTNTTYSNMSGATSSAAGKAGLVPAPSAGASNRYLRSDGAWVVPPDTNTTYSNMGGATSSAAGKAGLVPAPSAGSQAKYLRGDGTWQTPPNTTYSAATTSTAGLMSAADKTKLDGIASGANKYTLPTASSSTLGGVKTTSNVTSTSGLTPCPIISGVPYYKDTNTTYSLSSFGITATASELNKLDGVTATAAELNYVDGVTSNIQTQLNNKADNSVVSDEVTQSDIDALFS